MSKKNTAPNVDKCGMSPGDWAALKAMTEDEIIAAAMNDPDNPPLSESQLAQLRRIALARFVRRKLGLSAEQFAYSYGIPLETLHAWEWHEAEPTAAEQAYLNAILRAPEATRKPAA